MNSPDTPQQPENLLRSVPMLSASTLLLRNHAIDVDANHLTSGLPLNGEDISEELLNRALKRIGYEAVFTEDIQLQDLIFPCAILLSTGGYLVAIGRSSRTLQVLDGENLRSVRSIPLEHVKAQYDNRSFQILPNMDLLLEQHSVGPEQKHWFWGRLLLKRRSIFDVVLASLFANLLAVVTSLFALQIYDRVIPSQSQPTLWVLASGVGLAILFEAVLRISRAKLIDQVGKEAEIEICSDIFARVLGMKLDKRPASPGAIAHMAREFSAVKEFFTSAAVGVVSDLPFAIVFLLLIYGIAGHVVWIILIGAVLIVLPNLALQGRIARLSEESMGGMSSASRLLTEASYGLETVKSTQSESRFQRQWEEIIALNSIKTTQQRAIRAFLTYWATSIQQAAYVFAVIACVYMIFAGELSTGAIIAVGILTTRTLSPISQLSQTLSGWQNMKTALGALEAVMTSEQERQPGQHYIRRPRLQGRVSLDKARFSYTDTSSVAIDIAQLDLKPGTRLAVLGANGSGKSSLLKLMAGLYAPSEGEVLLDGLDLRQIDPTDLRRNIAYLPQDVQLFRGTLFDNLSSSLHVRTKQDMLDALDFAGVGNFVRHHPLGLDFPIADGGFGLSIGQRQSIGLARLYLQDPSVILLDEPTSALDNNLENGIVPRIGKWIGSRTCIIATHRPPILSQMTHIAILHEGRITLFGNRDDVLKKITTPQPSGLAQDAS